MKQALVDVDSPPDGAECPSPFPRTPPADPQDWQSVHQQLVRLSEHKAAYDHAEPQWLLRASRMQVHLRLGYGSFYEYAERLFGYSPRETAERLRVAEALEELPEMASALRRNALPWTAVRELARVATPATEPQWIQAAKGRTVREIEKMVSGRKPGDGPSDPAHESARTLVVRFEVRAETLATLREAKAALIRRMGQHLTDDELILLLSREVLGGPSDEGRSPYQVALRVCDDCGKAHQEAGGDALPVEADVAERAACDSQRIGAVGGPDVETGEQDPPMRPSDAKPTHVGQPGIDSTHVGLPIQPPRASQTIPPAVRRQVLRRDGGKCLVPGCRNHAFLEVHHSEPRAEGGTHDPDLLATPTALVTAAPLRPSTPSFTPRPFPRSRTSATKKPKPAPRSTGPRPTWVQTRASPSCSGWRSRECRDRERRG
jgi:hypothetical protein